MDTKINSGDKFGKADGEFKKQEVICSCVKARYIQLLLFAVVRGLFFGSRGILSIAIVAMTTEETSSNPNIPVYNWTINSVILSSFYWSYAIVQFFACWISNSHGPKWYMGGAVLTDAVINLLIPLVVDTLGPNGLMACRVAQGVSQGMGIPLLAQLMGKWFPTEERTWMYSVVVFATYLGITVVKLTSGFIAASWVGWPAIFYIYGSIGVVVGLFWIIFGYSNPADHSRISEAERIHIESSLGQDIPLQVKSIPWKGIFTSLPFWAILASSIGESWSTTFVSTELPTYFAKVLLLDISSNGVFTTITYAVGALSSMTYGPLIDFLIYKGFLTRATARRFFNTIGLFVPAICFSVVTYVTGSYAVAVSIFVISYMGRAAIQHIVNMLDVTPMFAGILMGLANGFGQLIAILAPLSVQFIVYDESDVTLWRIVFMLSATIFVVTNIFYVIFMSADRQWWDSGDNSKLNRQKRISIITSEMPELRS